MEVIEIESLSKKFVIKHESGAHQRYTALRDVISGRAKRIANWSQDANPEREEFWALRDVSFSVKKGDRFGIIGRNGAGKSTLLKILSRITEPSGGAVKIKGRVASLLEVGTGFHPELTGRENIFLNGAILGMTRKEIRTKFDEIVAFAEIEKFLDTPVKRYSSGMYVRLAFAVAAHLDPEILIIDEVLAVGDAQFQKKCLNKMEEISVQDGRTLLFVSHNMAALMEFCNKGIVLTKGQKTFEGPILQAINAYNEETTQRRTSDIKILSKNLVIETISAGPAEIWSLGDLEVKVKLKAIETDEEFKSFVIIIERAGKRIGIVDLRPIVATKIIKAGYSFELFTRINLLPLIEGEYDISIYIESTSVAKDFLSVASFNVLPKKSNFAGYVPYDLSVRGQIEFSHQTEFIESR